VETITSRQNALVRTFRTLARGYDEADGRLLLEGVHLVQEAIAAGVRIETAAIAARLLERDAAERRSRRAGGGEPERGRTNRGTRGGAGGEAHSLAERLTAGGSRVVAVTEPVMAAMSPVKTPSGVLAIARHRAPSLEAALSAAAGVAPLVLLLADVQDPGNLGAIIRTAEAAGATGAVACGVSADPFGWKALRGAMGSSLRLPVAVRPAVRDVIAAARQRGLRIVATDPHGGRSLYETDFRPATAILVGGEGPGLAREIITLADETINIPMYRPVESLNVAVSAALILYEA
jgi:TrmH family RNA methyltransferase